MIEVYEAIRWANLSLAGTVTLLLLCRLRAFYRAPWPSKVGRLTVFGWVTSTGYGTWESLHLSAHPGPRIPAVTSVLLLSGYYVWTEWMDDRRNRRLTAAVTLVLRDSQPGSPPGR